VQLGRNDVPSALAAAILLSSVSEETGSPMSTLKCAVMS
jgi:hypothetical protein